jgi:enoyl-CoA hydratase/carnithine racemase
LPRLVGFQRAKEMILSGRQVGAEEALAIGLADKVAPSGDLLDLALEDARELATRATVAVAAAKQALSRGFGQPVASGVEVEREAFQRAFGSDDAREGVSAFVEKRPPRFKGS